jgi:hypothetical protein
MCAGSVAAVSSRHQHLDVATERIMAIVLGAVLATAGLRACEIETADAHAQRRAPAVPNRKVTRTPG